MHTRFSSLHNEAEHKARGIVQVYGKVEGRTLPLVGSPTLKILNAEGAADYSAKLVTASTRSFTIKLRKDVVSK